ncbi:parapinopsin [Rothia dentocariosa]|uniref:parapinopsin n=1 Tax=Rothia dentocariosa TaxID=2047 RepID=UPI0028E6D609|nr:parapinopsin [Rothia dentocariosa]
MRVRDCVYWGWGPFWALVVQVLIWWPIVGLVVRVAPSHPMMGPHLPFYVVLFSLPFVGIAVNFCLFRLLHPRRALGWMVPVAFGFMFLFGLFPMPFRGLSMLGFGSVVCGLYPGILLNNYYELYRVAKMSPEEVEAYKIELEQKNVKYEENSDTVGSIYAAIFCITAVFMTGFFSLAIPAMIQRSYDPSPMLLPTVIVATVGLWLSVVVKRILKWNGSWRVYAVLLVVSVVGVLWGWGYPIVLVVAPWWMAYWVGDVLVDAVEFALRRVIRFEYS